MNKKQTKIDSQKKKDKPIPLGLTSRNYQIFGIGMLVLIIGYFFLSKGPVNGAWSLTIGPILLFISYCVIIPYAVIYRKKEATPKVQDN